MRGLSRCTIATAAALAIVGALGSIANAQASIRIDLPAQSLADSLKAIASQTNTNVLFNLRQVEGLQAPAISGDLTPEQAVARLLSGTGLTQESVNEHTIVVTPVAGKKTAFWAGTTEKIRVAAADVAGTSEKSEGTEGVKIEEVVVTAQKREQALVDVPMSIGVVSADQLDRRGISDTVDIALSVPGIGFQDRGGASLRYVFLRGLGNTRGSQAMVGVYLDDQDVTSFPFNALDLRAYDLERLELLRGPQGTLYGSGAMGGVLRYITKKINLVSTSGDAYMSVSATQSGAPSRSTGGSLNLPLIPDTLGLRVSGLYEHSGGWIDQPAASKSNINDEQLYSFRVKSLWRPVDVLEISSTIMVQHNDAGAPNVGEDANGNFTQSFGRTITPSGSNRFETYGLVAKYSADRFEILSSTGYFDYSNVQKDVGYGFPTAPPPAVANDLLSDPSIDTSVRALTQELRASSVGWKRFSWTAGGSFRNAERTEASALLFGLPSAVAPALLLTPTSESSRAWAIFGEGSATVGTRTTLGAGLRYYRDTQENKITRQSGDFDQVSPRFFGTFAIRPAINVYANIAKGFRSGGFNTPFSIALGAPATFKSDLIWSYELGSKGVLLDGRVHFDLAAFYSDYRGAQDSGFRQVGNAVINVVGNIGNAVIKGVDWDTALMVADGISVGSGGEYLDGKYTRIDAISATQAVGDSLKQIPKYHANAWAMYEWSNWLGGARGYFRVEYNRHGVAEYRNRSIGAWYVSESDPIDMLNASVGWEKGVWSVGVFAHNLLNDRGYIDAESIDRLAARSRPRTYGIKTAVAF